MQICVLSEVLHQIQACMYSKKPKKQMWCSFPERSVLALSEGNIQKVHFTNINTSTNQKRLSFNGYTKYSEAT